MTLPTWNTKKDSEEDFKVDVWKTVFMGGKLL
jgi:hypothetical protein